MGALVRSDLGLKSLAKQKVQLLMLEQMDKRHERGHRIRNFLKGRQLGPVSHEKEYMVDKFCNRTNDRYIAKLDPWMLLLS